MINKIKLLFIPFIVVLIGQAIAYTFLHWVLVIVLQIMPSYEPLTHVIIPIVVSVLTYFIYLRQRIHLLKIHDFKGNGKFGYLIGITVAIMLPTIVAQDYMQKETGKLSQLDHIEQINTKAPTQYYMLKNCYIDTSNAVVYHDTSFNTKYKDFNMYRYYALPILSQKRDTSGKVCKAWYIFNYQKTIRSNLDATRQQEEYKKFAQESQAQFDSTNFYNFAYLERLDRLNIDDGYVAGIEKNGKYESKSPVFLSPCKEPFEMRSENALEDLWIAMTVSVILYLTMILIPSFDPDRLRNYLNQMQAPKKKK